MPSVFGNQPPHFLVFSEQMASPSGLPGCPVSSPLGFPFLHFLYPEQGERGSQALSPKVYFYALIQATAGGSVGSWGTFALRSPLFTSHGVS